MLLLPFHAKGSSYKTAVRNFFWVGGSQYISTKRTLTFQNTTLTHRSKQTSFTLYMLYKWILPNFRGISADSSMNTKMPQHTSWQPLLKRWAASEQISEWDSPWIGSLWPLPPKEKKNWREILFLCSGCQPKHSVPRVEGRKGRFLLTITRNPEVIQFFIPELSAPKMKP